MLKSPSLLRLQLVLSEGGGGSWQRGQRAESGCLLTLSIHTRENYNLYHNKRLLTVISGITMMLLCNRNTAHEHPAEIVRYYISGAPFQLLQTEATLKRFIYI